jgi:hypothetical protein
MEPRSATVKATESELRQCVPMAHPTLGERLSTDVTKTSALDFQKTPVEPTANQPTANQQTKEPPMTNGREHPHDDLRREPPTEVMVSLSEVVRHEAEVDIRHCGPIEAALPKETEGYEWKRETGDIESYKHDQTGAWIHVDSQGQFHDREAQPIDGDAALVYAGHEAGHNTNDNAVTKDANDQALSMNRETRWVAVSVLVPKHGIYDQLLVVVIRCTSAFQIRDYAAILTYV